MVHRQSDISPRCWKIAAGALALTPILSLLVFDPSHFVRFSAPKLAIVWCGLFVGVMAIGKLHPILRTGDLPWLLFLGWAAVSLSWSPAPGRGATGLAIWSAGWVGALLMARLLNDRFRDPAAVTCGFAAAWLCGAIPCAIVALVQRFGFWKLGFHQVTSTVGNPNRLAVVLLLHLPFARLLIRTADRRVLRALGWIGGSLVVFAILATRCHGAMFALLAMIVYWIVTSELPERNRIILTAAVIAVGILAPFHRSTRTGVVDSLKGRAYLAQVSGKVIHDSPVKGTGLGGYPAASARAQGDLLAAKKGRYTNLREAHNQPLMVASELGLPGLLLACVVLLPMLLSCIRRRQDPVANEALAAWLGLLVVCCTETALDSPAVILYAFFWLALGAGPNKKSPASIHTVSIKQATGTVMANGFCIAVAGWAAWHTTTQLAADYHLGKGLRLASGTEGPVTRKRLNRAVRHYTKGLRIARDPSRLLFHRAVALRHLGRPEQARKDMEAAFKRLSGPDRALFLGDLALQQERTGDALAWYRRAVRLHPGYARGYNNLGVALLRTGRPAEACRYLTRARSLRPYEKSIRENWTRYCRTRPAGPVDPTRDVLMSYRHDNHRPKAVHSRQRDPRVGLCRRLFVRPGRYSRSSRRLRQRDRRVRGGMRRREHR